MADLKTLKVCLSEELPDILDRKSNFIYFLYDKLVIFIGQSLYSECYAIVESMPDKPISGMLYFVLEDGTVQIFVDYSNKIIANIESQEQLEILKQAGTTFFVNADKRYLDLSRRIVTLPYRNGTYELTVSLANDLIIDQDTVIKFNPETNQFEIYGHVYEPIIDASEYIGKNTNSIKTNVSGNRISSEVRISDKYSNIIRVLPDGLYAKIPTSDSHGRVTTEQFEKWLENYTEYKTELDSYLKELQEQVDSFIPSEESINAKILAALEERYSEIDKILESYDDMVKKMNEIESNVNKYTDKVFEETHDKIVDNFDSKINNLWGTI